MKKVVLSIIIALLSILSIAQVPESFNYQAIPRNAGGGTYPDQAMKVRISILSVSPTGNSVYTETFNATTTSLGLINLQIGKGTPVSGSFTTINWGTSSYFLKVEIDPAGGTSYVVMGTTQLLSVPYALHSKTAGNGSLWSQSGSNIYFNNGKIGIGTSSPATYIHAHGAPVASRGQLSLSSPTGQGTFISFYEADIFKAYLWYDVTDQDLRLQNFTSGDLNLNPYGGKVGIGTNTPTESLTVNGNTEFNGNIIPKGKIIAQGNINIESSGNNVIILAGTNKITISPSGGVTIESNNITLAATGNLTLSGANVQINGDQIGINANQGEVKIKAMNTAIEAQTSLSLKGTSLDLKANASAKLVGGATTEVSSSGALTIKGSMVMIN